LAGEVSEPRQAPQYGEFASPEQQAKAMGLPWPPPPVAESSVPILDPVPAEATRSQRVGARLAIARRWDVMLCTILLAYGLYSVVSGLFQFADLGTVISELFRTQGIGGYRATALTPVLGAVINVVNLLVFIATAYVTYRVLISGRVAFYIPIIGVLVSGAIGTVCLLILLFQDPNFVTYLTKMNG
jgi:hypothetical protein